MCVCVQGWENSKSGKIWFGLHLSVGSSGETHLRGLIRCAQELSSVLTVFLLHCQEKNFLQMVLEAGSPGIQKQIIKSESLKSMEDRYERVLQELADVIKVKSKTGSSDFLIFFL